MHYPSFHKFASMLAVIQMYYWQLDWNGCATMSVFQQLTMSWFEYLAHLFNSKENTSQKNPHGQGFFSPKTSGEGLIGRLCIANTCFSIITPSGIWDLTPPTRCTVMNDHHLFVNEAAHLNEMVLVFPGLDYLESLTQSLYPRPPLCLVPFYLRDQCSLLHSLPLWMAYIHKSLNAYNYIRTDIAGTHIYTGTEPFIRIPEIQKIQKKKKRPILKITPCAYASAAVCQYRYSIPIILLYTCILYQYFMPVLVF